MQANFYNVTGRMVPLHVIRDRCARADEEEEEEEESERRRRERQRRREVGVGREMVESWVGGVDQENLGDPEA